MSQDCHSKLDDEKNREEDLLVLHFRGEHHEFTQLHHAFNLNQKGTVSQDCLSKFNDEKDREEDLLVLHLRGEHHEFT